MIAGSPRSTSASAPASLAPADPKRLYSLDVLRGLAALAVVFWHWQHFYYAGSVAPRVEPANLPLFPVFGVLYRHGWAAVDLFFTLSGFVFYWLYSGAITTRKVSPAEFAWFRFSRLYPLHLLTLLAVLLGQLLFLEVRGDYFVYPNNDAYHLLLNVAGAASWGLERGLSFNGPFWSVSVELLLYAVFFVVCRWLLGGRFLTVLLFALIGFSLLMDVYPPLGRGFGSFFVGGAAYLAYRWVRDHDPHGAAHAMIIAFGVLATVGTAAALGAGEGSTNVLINWTQAAIGGPLTMGVSELLSAVEKLWIPVVLFPLMVLSLALAEAKIGTLGKRFAWLGDISYSVYLIHFPLQLLFIAVAAMLGLGGEVFADPWVLALFLCMVVSVSIASHRCFEVPVQAKLRSMKPWLLVPRVAGRLPLRSEALRAHGADE